ncbi:MAG: DUF1549 domain-containing protein [Fimbriiglobus sp.]|nr:DUF1549 domain-containing protein [Fimbriiglobus sp.]
MPRRSLAFAAVLVAYPLFAADAPSYLHEVVPVLTKAGCNQGACHGKGAGQNGFKLSLRGYDPEADHRSLTREFDGRRVDPADPVKSLLLTKPLAAVPHEGGRMFTDTSREYQTLLAWVQAGCPGPDAKSAAIAKLDITPGDKVMKPGEKQQLTATATFSDGTTKDVTWLTKFDTNDAAVCEVTPGGRVTAKRNGATAVRAAFLTEVAVVTVAVPFDKPVDEAKFAVRNNAIDDGVFAKLKELRIEPSGLSSDAEFLRRVYLDVIGTLPTPAEVKAFLADTAADKRTKAIDSLLDRPEFVDYWTLFLSDLLQNRKERDHDVRGVKGVRQFHAWIREQVAAGKGWNEIARGVLTATGDTTSNPQVGYYVVTVGEHREVEKSEAAESVAQAFLGTRIGCARCHNHPLERYTQDDFYHFSAFFTRIKLDRKDPKQGPTVLKVSHHDANQNKEPVRVRQPRTNQMLAPQPLDRSAAVVSNLDDPRVKLADWITDPRNEQFSGAMVNRVWKHFLGVGLVEPVDDLRATNPPSIPTVWNALTTEFVKQKYSLKELVRFVVSSRTYQLTSATTPGNATDARFYSHYYPRRLPAEVLLDAISSATGTTERFDGYPEGVRAIQIPNPSSHSQFLKMFGSSERVTACACERTGDVTLPQLLSLQNGELPNKVKYGTVLMPLNTKQPDPTQYTEELFLRSLSRLPSADERAAVTKALASGDHTIEVYRDVLWALLNAKEFAFNH